MTNVIPLVHNPSAYSFSPAKVFSTSSILLAYLHQKKWVARLSSQVFHSTLSYLNFKESSATIEPFVLTLFNSSFSSGVVPRNFKHTSSNLFWSSWA